MKHPRSRQGSGERARGEGGEDVGRGGGGVERVRAQPSERAEAEKGYQEKERKWPGLAVWWVKTAPLSIRGPKQQKLNQSTRSLPFP